MKTILTAVALCGLLAGCSSRPVKWESPAASEAQAGQDRQECRSWAARQVEREARDEPMGTPEPSRLGSSYEATMRPYDFRRREIDLYNSCMKQRGYQPAEKK